jgi:cysteine-rich repeat protein
VIPQPVVRIPGSPNRNACQAEWELGLPNPAVNPASSLPRGTQSCIDGDGTCDVDGANDGRCTIRTRLCLRVQDSRLPACAPAPIEHVQLKFPRPLSPADEIDAANVEGLRAAVAALGVTVRQGTTVLHPGVPDPTSDHCTTLFDVVVPHAARKGRRRLTVGTGDVTGARMTSNALKLDCFPNTAVCGDGEIGLGETCDDGNTQGCDGCSPTCREEGCGNGRIDCDEQCDDGPLNQPLGTACTARCTEVAPALRIPGGGSRTVDCAQEWSVALDSGAVIVDKRGVPRNRQDCIDGDPGCDFEPLPGACRFHLFACLGGADARLGCPSASVTSIEVLRPRLDGDPLRDALVQAFAELAPPIGPGEVCTRRVDFEMPASRQRAVMKTRARLATGKSDPDTLKLRCLPSP